MFVKGRSNEKRIGKIGNGFGENFPDSAEYHEREDYVNCDDGSGVCDVFWAGGIYRYLSNKRSTDFSTSGIINFLGMDGTSSQYVPKKRIFKKWKHRREKK